MAEEKSLEELEREITCAICQEHYTEPKILPCLHYYCKQCVLRLALRTATGQPFSCPECRSDATLPEGGVDELKTAFFINRLKTTVSKLERVHGKVEAICELCVRSNDRAQAFCRQCAMFICNECVNSHKRMKPFLTHQVALLDDLKHGRTNPITIQQPPVKKCLDHEEPLIIFCFDCSKLLCHHCTVKDHKDHAFEFCKKAAPQTKAKLLEKIQPLKELSKDLSSGMEQINNIREELEHQGENAATSVRSSFKELYEILVQYEQKLLEEVKVKVNEKVEKLALQGKNLSQANADIQSIVDYTEQCVRHCTDSEVMSMHTEIRRRIEQKIEEHSKSDSSLEPVAEADIGVEVKCAEALQQLCQTQANIVQLDISLAKSTITMDNVAEVSKVSKATVTTKLSSNKITKKSCKISSHLKCLSNGAKYDCKVSPSGTGEYFIEYVPIHRGYHELSVLINGEYLPGNPFPIIVTLQPTQLGKPINVWIGITKPTGITVNSTGEILVTEFTGNILKFSADGKRELLVKQNKLNTLRSIAVDDGDNIYCANKTSNEILTCDKNGGNIQIHEVTQLRGPGHHWVKVVGEKVMTAECYSIGMILVYDRNFVYRRRFEHKGMGEIGDVAVDELGCLYASDYTNSCIQVFNSSGSFVRSFDCSLDGATAVEKPRGICLSGLYLYITNGSHNVTVFTTSGDHVTTFGQQGTKKGEFRKLNYICMDQSGFLYVTDYKNNRVQCF